MSLQTFHIASDQWELTAPWFPGHTRLLLLLIQLSATYIVYSAYRSPESPGGGGGTLICS